MLRVGDAGEGHLVLQPPVGKRLLIFGPDGDDYGVPLDKLRIIAAQLRHVPLAEGSAEAAVKDQNNVLFAPEVGEAYYLALAAGHLEGGGGRRFSAGVHGVPRY